MVYYPTLTRCGEFFGIFQGLYALWNYFSSAFACTPGIFVCGISHSVSSFVWLILRMLMPCLRWLVQMSLLMPLLTGHCNSSQTMGVAAP